MPNKKEVRMAKKQDETKVLKDLVKALDKMCLHYRMAKPTVPEWVFDNIDKAKKYYNVTDISKIK